LARARARAHPAKQLFPKRIARTALAATGTTPSASASPRLATSPATASFRVASSPRGASLATVRQSPAIPERHPRRAQRHRGALGARGSAAALHSCACISHPTLVKRLPAVCSRLRTDGRRPSSRFAAKCLWAGSSSPTSWHPPSGVIIEVDGAYHARRHSADAREISSSVASPSVSSA
jgi:hypothetical protein